jgi:hypothetical protein
VNLHRRSIKARLEALEAKAAATGHENLMGRVRCEDLIRLLTLPEDEAAAVWPGIAESSARLEPEDLRTVPTDVLERLLELTEKAGGPWKKG